LPRPGSASEYLSASWFPPAIPNVSVIKRTVNDVEYVSPVDSLGNCWAIIPCSEEAVPTTLHLLDSSKGISGGLGS
jgi:hypothetical protein